MLDALISQTAFIKLMLNLDSRRSHFNDGATLQVGFDHKIEWLQKKGY